MWETVASNVISWPTCVATKINAIAKIHKYKGLYEEHHFILMAMEVHNAPKHNINHFIKECARFFHNKRSRGHLSLFFNIQFFRQHVSIALWHALTSTIKRKITLVRDVYSKPSIIIRYHDSHVDDIRRAMGEITSFHKRD
jgi:hypothetical protein